jgi:Domain of unknown function (DUF4214)
MANGFVHSAEFVNTYGALTDQQYIEQLYHNVLGRVGSQAEVDAWLATGSDRAHILVGFAESSEFIADSTTGVQHYLDQLASGQQPTAARWLEDLLWLRLRLIQTRRSMCLVKVRSIPVRC